MRVIVLTLTLLMALATEGMAQTGVIGSQQTTATPNAVQAPQATQPAEILPEFVNALGASGIKNITDAEHVFCYEVTSKPANYQGYTLNNVAVNGFCGVLNRELTDMIVNQLFEMPENVVFNQAENCMVSPRIMLRFVRGIDSTDVMVSSPCHSIVVFYAGKVQAYNMKPSVELIDTMVNAFGENRIDFVSPALLNQLLPVGVPQNIEQQTLVESKKQAQPIRNWTPAGEAAKTDAPASGPKKSGWGKLNI